MSDPLYDSITPELKARFWAKVIRRGPDECWHWHKPPTSYGTYPNFKGAPAGHWLLRFSGKPRPPGFWSLHSCDNFWCVNPAHLRWGTRADNDQDQRERGYAKRMAKAMAAMAGWSQQDIAAELQRMETRRIYNLAYKARRAARKLTAANKGD